MSPPQPQLPKKDVALALLERSTLFVHLDPRAEGVVVPTRFKDQPRLVLQVGLNMSVPIPDLRIDDEGLSCTLHFNRSPFFCVVPWPSVFAMIGEDTRCMVWPDDVPIEVARGGPERVPDAPSRPGLPKVVAVPDAKGDGAGRKRSKKRPRLQAAAPGAASVRAFSPSTSPQGQGAPQRKAVAAPAPGAGLGPRGRKRRELPPYLRVVK
jgi:hypothetical protein